MTKRLSKAERLRKKIEEAEFLRRVREGLLPARKTVLVCEKHDYRVPVSTSKPPPPPTFCPGCRAEQRRDDGRREERSVEHPAAISKATFRQEELAALWMERHPSTSPEPGSAEEREALDRIDELREEREEGEARKHGRGGRFVSGRIEGGEWIEFYAIPGRRGLVRVGASR